MNEGINVATNINEPITSVEIQNPNLPYSMDLKPVSNAEIIMHISSLKTKSAPEIDEKLKVKRKLEEDKQNLSAELTQLQNRHSQLTVMLKNQKSQQEHLITTQQNAEDKINMILQFINTMKKSPPIDKQDNL